MCLCISLSHTCILLSFSILQFLLLHYAGGFSSKAIHTFSSSKLYLLYSSVTARTIPVFPDTLLRSFIEGCFKQRSCSFVAHLQKMTSSGGTAWVNSLLWPQPSASAARSWRQMPLATWTKAGQIGKVLLFDSQILWQPLLSVVCTPRVVLLQLNQCNAACLGRYTFQFSTGHLAWHSWFNRVKTPKTKLWYYLE